MYLYAYIHTYKYMYVHICTYIYIHVYIYIYNNNTHMKTGFSRTKMGTYRNVTYALIVQHGPFAQVSRHVARIEWNSNITRMNIYTYIVTQTYCNTHILYHTYVVTHIYCITHMLYHITCNAM